MKTQDGRECPYFYADYYRRSSGIVKCLLLEGKSDASQWRTELCRACRIPDIRRANSCPDMYFVARVSVKGWKFWQPVHMIIRILCKRSAGEVANPMVGCGQCHRPLVFAVSDDDSEQTKSG